MSDNVNLPVITKPVSNETGALEPHIERSRMVRDYFGGDAGLVEKIRRVTNGSATIDDLIDGVSVEILAEADSLKGNEILQLNEGDIKGSTSAITKRIAALEKFARILQQKKIIDSEYSIDLNSPYVHKLVSYIFDKVKDVFESLGMDKEINNLFFMQLREKTSNWRKEIGREFDELRERQKELEREKLRKGERNG